MVRVNIINPSKLADQHLIAEYNEILMLLGFVKKNPNKKVCGTDYCLGEGHINFFKDKLLYLKKRHELLKKEMLNRGFKPLKTIDLSCFADCLKKEWSPSLNDFNIINERLKSKILSKPNYYKYYGLVKNSNFFINLLK